MRGKAWRGGRERPGGAQGRDGRKEMAGEGWRRGSGRGERGRKRAREGIVLLGRAGLIEPGRSGVVTERSGRGARASE